jgi:hypothetical protein
MQRWFYPFFYYVASLYTLSYVCTVCIRTSVKYSPWLSHPDPLLTLLLLDTIVAFGRRHGAREGADKLFGVFVTPVTPMP